MIFVSGIMNDISTLFNPFCFVLRSKTNQTESNNKKVQLFVKNNRMASFSLGKPYWGKKYFKNKVHAEY